MKRGIQICFLLLLTVCLCGTRSGASGRTGSITVMMRAGEMPIPGGMLVLYYIDVSIDGELTPERAKELEAQMQLDAGIRQAINKDGKVFFSELEPGIYLVTQPEASAGYRKMQPFLVPMPLEQNGALHYDIVAYPKLEKLPADLETPDTGQKDMLLPLILSGGGLLALVLGKRREA